MRHLFPILLAMFTGLLLPAPVWAQPRPVGDEWIRFQQEYYKIPVAQNAIYRLTQQELVRSGIPASVPGAKFRLYRLGQEVPLTTSASGVLGSGDFLEFAGFKNDGAADAALYASEAFQADPGRSLFSDTAWYFLTWSDTGMGLRHTNATAAIPANPASVASRCRATVHKSYNGFYHPGKTNNMRYEFFSSKFEEGEGFLHGKYSPGWSFTDSLRTPEAIAGADAELTTGVAGSSLDYGQLPNVIPAPAHPIKIYAGSQLLVDTTYGAQQYRRFRRTLSGGPQSAVLPLTYQTTVVSAPNYDYWGVAFAAIAYWRTLNYSGESNAGFELEGSAVDQLLAVRGVAASRLYDLTNRQYYDADLSVAGEARFYLKPSAQPRKCLMATTPAIRYPAIGDKAHFQDFSAAGAGGDYVMISHPALEADGALSAYKDYRASAAGGGHTPLLVYTQDLYDQFAGGISQHPLALSRFLARLQQSAAVKPAHVALIGHGVSYPIYRSGRPAAAARALVPTFGHPGSDALFTDGTVGAPAVGRISVLSGTELRAYLDKVKTYETALRAPSMPVYETEGWKKKVLHIAGSSRPEEQAGLLATLNNAAAVISDTAFGGHVFTIAKNTTNPVDPFTNSFVDSVINEGMGIMTFHGHAYAGGFDYNINDPEVYTNSPKLPLFIALGCNVAQIFDTGARTISERYLLAPKGGAISMLAADLLQFTDFHALYLQQLYGSISDSAYGKSIGQQISSSYAYFLKNYAGDHFRTNLEAMIYQGDPALRLHQAPQPDFHVSAEGILTTPAQITSAIDSFRMQIVAYNLAKGFRDTGLRVRVSHTNPAGETKVLREYPLSQLLYSDTTTLTLGINKIQDLGLNRFTVTIDPENRIAEMAENNNNAVYELFISGNNLIPVFPYDYSIVGSTPELKASTLNPFAAEATYLLEIDTTVSFNSPLLRQTRLTGKGGLVKWKPDIPYTDSTVYYWRAAYAPAAGSNPVWSSASFVYLPGAGPGWNQSHAYQYVPNALDSLNYEADADRRFRFNRSEKRIYVRSKVMMTDADVDNNKVQVNEVDVQRSSCMLYNTTIQIMVIDSATGEIWKNTPARVAAFGSADSCKANRSVVAFEFPVNDSVGRNKAMKFLKAIPNGKFVLARSSVYNITYNPTNALSWIADTQVYGPGNTLYHTLKEMGLTQLDSFANRRVFVLWTQKGVPGYVPFARLGMSDTTIIAQEFRIHPFKTQGAMKSIVVGPSQAWKSLHWRAEATDEADTADKNTVQIYGVRPNGEDTLLMETQAPDTRLEGSAVRAYPYLRLQWKTEDSAQRSAGQLRYWRVHYTPVPELALNPAAYLALNDSVAIGQELSATVAIENVSDQPMDSVLVRYRVVKEDSRIAPLQKLRYRPLAAHDTLHASIRFGSVPYGGSNFLFVEANPDTDQPERYHPNNLGYIPFFVKKDVLNPLLDVTFDGVHISDRDIVASRPEVKIRLTGQNRYRLLDDTSLIQLFLKAPDDPISLSGGTRIYFDSTVCRFFPARADSSGKLRNEAYVLYRPVLTQYSTSPDNNLYELLVKAKDAAGIAAGSEDYRVSFRTVATSGITQVYNFPNPFTTTTRFAFTITGDALPKDLRIQIADMTGSLVRTITKAELGPLRIGLNHTAFAWDGRDAGGTLLSDGIYFYRAVVEGDKGAMQHLPTNRDQYFKGGWGRMLFLRR